MIDVDSGRHGVVAARIFIFMDPTSGNLGSCSNLDDFILAFAVLMGQDWVVVVLLAMAGRALLFILWPPEPAGCPSTGAPDASPEDHDLSDVTVRRPGIRSAVR